MNSGLIKKFLSLFIAVAMGAFLWSNFSVASPIFVNGKVVHEDPISKLLKQLKAWSSKANIEKVHLHLDKTHYNLGDHIWFKAIVTEFETLAPTERSEVLYVDLFDAQDSLSNRAVLRLHQGLGHGQFFLPDSLKEGNYRIRAYTRWMQNAGPDFYFSKNIKVLSPAAAQVSIISEYSSDAGPDMASDASNSDTEKFMKLSFRNSLNERITKLKVNYYINLKGKTLAKGNSTTNSTGDIFLKLPKDLNNNSELAQLNLKFEHFNRDFHQILTLPSPIEKVSLQFFPESGQLIAGLSNRMAFKATDLTGKGKSIAGEIVNEAGEVVSTFESSHLGMGSFFILPNAGTSYTAKFKVGDNQFETVKLPKVEEQGYVIQVANANGLNSGYHQTGKIQVRVLMSEQLLGKGDLYLVVHQNGRESFSAVIPTQKTLAMVNLPISEIGSGVSTISLLNSNFIPVAERLIFVNNPIDFMDIKALNLKSSYAPKEKMDLKFSAAMSQGLSDASFSVSVTNTLNYLPDTLNESHIYSSLLLESDIRGLIENPNYYFDSANLSRFQDLDHLLLTQGWRKLDWQAIAANQEPTSQFQVQKNLTIRGNVNAKIKPNEKLKVVLFTQNLGMGIDTLASANGDFVFDKLAFADSTKFIFQARNAANKTVDGIRIFPDIPAPLSFSEKVDKAMNISNLDKIIENRWSKELNYQLPSSLKGTIGLKQVVIKEYVEEKSPIVKSSNLNGPGRADIVITVKDFGPGQTLQEVLILKAFSFMETNRNTFGGSRTEPIFIFDGTIIESTSPRYFDILGMRVETIGSIEILKSPSYTTMYGSRGSNGVILINTRNYFDVLENNEDLNSPIRSFLAKGYLVPKTFYSPDYSTQTPKSFDNRVTVYWNPSILSDEKGNFGFNYFNTDEKGTYRIVIEGININGEMVRKVLYYSVK